ncbi:oxysterol-binding protein-related protein 3 isoform X1 [Carcharodon carcharias]|uniref:oxysterol-binding protein-related protein 3 isoform X1 n=1 Tax=Carcharodon carcharias TaxID=13397 RepID=UPI001B7EEC1C|nr:oxysterol-binding protein-related protein 3 isoform X1 [Carcharodon carcharias]XP_041039743.1 oxysterol-binding protein-related protein 3 isoform X1 [Carcharodon carcharias]XP_041039745.1 oxysterol-binding protein-related protein 3 isoform X1 [Carcharodon carcharias]XP_041039746.1 oxysterol-binding protein-related protein 3 isoform X1 [Carcharodon carcharias]XP_041039747.1 oxysterol-binding protein-related protein 3 isoform X1 [Carcharodon carcharias]XP_041039748.1 oxysterol-binding protein
MNSDGQSIAVPQKLSSPSQSSSSSFRPDIRQDSWEIVEGLRDSMSNIQEPQKQEGYLLKKRKWPLKGWHKRYFFLDKGIMKYSKSQADIEKGKLHGCIDVGLSVMSIKKKTKRIDLDTEEHIYHLKVKFQESFDDWVAELRHHRLYRQNEIAKFPHDVANHFFTISSAADSSPSSLDSPSFRKLQRGSLTKQLSFQSSPTFPLAYASSQSKVAAWLQSSEDIDKCSRDLFQCHSSLTELTKLLQNMEVIHRTYSAPTINAIQGYVLESPKKEKRLPRRWRTKSFGKEAKSTLQVPSISASPMRLHASNPNLSEVFYAETKPFSDGSDLPSDYSKLQEDFCHIAQEVHSALNSVFNSLIIEKEKFKQMISEHDACRSPSPQIIGLKTALASQQDLVQVTNPLVHQLSNESRVSRADSLSEFFDAQEVLLSASSSENEASDDDSYVSDISDNISEDNLSTDAEPNAQNICNAQNGTSHHARRRSCLPAPGPNNSNISLWNILRNNIGKDLSKVSMPVQLNEPVNTLQRLCEELEYSELLDKASQTDDPFERMVFVAAFAVSAYASSYYRAGSKPFNPVLGETYECVRKEQGFRFIAEQVSHHPPISACHAESKNFTFWQDVRWKNKFWGKSMEIVPVGTIHVTLPSYGDHYEWNKVTSCVHNILSGQRWIEHYGEILIKNRNSSICQCKLTFVKAKYWNTNVDEVEGTIMGQNGKVENRLFGRWHEGIYCGTPPSATCIWRPNAMPKDFEQYYGLTKFALGLNEMEADEKLYLPRTDTRFRPDQRYLEEGNIEAAESQKERIEQLQRERRRILEENNMMYQPLFFRQSREGGKELWVSTGTYWELRKNPGFDKLDNPILW